MSRLAFNCWTDQLEAIGDAVQAHERHDATILAKLPGFISEKSRIGHEENWPLALRLLDAALGDQVNTGQS